MSPGVTIFTILLLCLVLIKAADGVVIALRRIAKAGHLKTFTVASLVIAVATSFPELSIGVASAFSGTPRLSFGNIVGANIANLSLVLGLAGFLAGTIRIRSGEFLNKELPLALVAGVIPFALVLDKTLSRIDGLILLFLYGGYASGLYSRQFLRVGAFSQEEGFWYRILRSIRAADGESRKEFARLFISLAILLITADFIVRLSGGFAQAAGVPIFLVGLILVSIGTTLPELVFSFRTILKGESEAALGNVLGSIIANSTLILGTVALISPISIDSRREYTLAVSVFILVILIFWIFTRTKKTLTRWEAGVLFLVYLGFVVSELSGFNPFGNLLK